MPTSGGKYTPRNHGQDCSARLGSSRDSPGLAIRTHKGEEQQAGLQQSLRTDQAQEEARVYAVTMGSPLRPLLYKGSPARTALRFRSRRSKYILLIRSKTLGLRGSVHLPDRKEGSGRGPAMHLGTAQGSCVGENNHPISVPIVLRMVQK